jgi:hypothetical protein
VSSFRAILFAIFLTSFPALAQDSKPMADMPGMKMGSGMSELMKQMEPTTFQQEILHHGCGA